MQNGQTQSSGCLHDKFERDLRIEMEPLWQEVAELWDRSQTADGFHAYVSADYEAVFRSLVELRGRATTFLEWGSGLGVVTIMASRLGFDAYGIEHEPELVEHANAFRERFGPAAHFVRGSFFPDAFHWTPEKGEAEVRTTIHGTAAYEEMGKQLSEFDLVYAYPWPEEHQLLRNVMQECGRDDTLFLTYDVLQGMALHRGGHKIR